MRPAEDEPDLPGRSVLEQALEPRVAVHLQDASELGQVGRRVLALAVLGVEVDHRRRGAAAPGPIVDRVTPEPSGLGPTPAGVEHRQRGSSRAGESHPRALTEPYVNLSAPTALFAPPHPPAKDPGPTRPG